MDHDNKVKKQEIIKKSKNTFLKDVSKFLDEKPRVYNLDEKFAETRKNKSVRLYFWVIGFLVSIICITLILTTIKEYKSRQVTFKISEFESVNLSELLSTVKKSEKKLEQAKKDISELKLKQQEEMQNIKAKYAREREKVLKKDLSSSEEKKRIKQLKNKEKREIANIKAKYKRRIKGKRGDIYKAQNEINQYDKKLQDATRKAEEMVNNYKRLHKLKMAEQRRNLIVKYNPYFYSPGLKKILANRLAPTSKYSFTLKNFEPDIARKKVYSEIEFNSIRQDVKNQALIIKRLRRVPYENSVAPSLVHLDSLSKNIVNNYEELWSRLAKRSLLINNYQYAFAHLAEIQAENGYIIDPRNSNNVKLYLKQSLEVRTGMTCLVFRTDDEFIGKIKLVRTRSGLHGEIISLEKDKKMNPFDKILIQMQEE